MLYSVLFFLGGEGGIWGRPHSNIFVYTYVNDMGMFLILLISVLFDLAMFLVPNVSSLSLSLSLDRSMNLKEGKNQNLPCSFQREILWNLKKKKIMIFHAPKKESSFFFVRKKLSDSVRESELDLKLQLCLSRVYGKQ